MSEPSEEMVELIALAMCEAFLQRVRHPLGVRPDGWKEFVPDAERLRAAISAMQLEGVDKILSKQTAESKPGGYGPHGSDIPVYRVHDATDEFVKPE